MKIKITKQICPRQMIQKAHGPTLDYKIWLKTEYGRGYRRCASGPQCYNQGGQCKYDHYQLYKPTEQEYYYNAEFYKLVAEKDKLGYQFKFDQYDNQNIEKQTNQYKEAFKRYQYLGHLFEYHKKAHYKMPCAILASVGCIKLGYCKDPKYAEKQKKIRKIQKIRHMAITGAYEFMKDKLGFGMYSDKTWDWVEQRHPQIFSEYLQNQFVDEQNKQIIKAIIQRRKTPKSEPYKLEQQQKVQLKQPSYKTQRQEKQPENVLLAHQYLQKMTNQYVYRRYFGNKLPCDESSVSVVGLITKIDQKQRKIQLEIDPIEKTTVQIIISTMGLAEFRQIKFIQVRGICKKDGSVEMKQYTNFNDNFGNFMANQDLQAYNRVIKLTSESAFKSMFGF